MTEDVSAIMAPVEAHSRARGHTVWADGRDESATQQPRLCSQTPFLHPWGGHGQNSNNSSLAAHIVIKTHTIRPSVSSKSPHEPRYVGTSGADLHMRIIAVIRARTPKYWHVFVNTHGVHSSAVCWCPRSERQEQVTWKQISHHTAHLPALLRILCVVIII
jgi:hypothetical protein